MVLEYTERETAGTEFEVEPTDKIGDVRLKFKDQSGDWYYLTTKTVCQQCPTNLIYGVREENKEEKEK